MLYTFRRLLPFYIASLIIELLETFVLCFIERYNIDSSFLSILRIFGVLLLQMTISFLYMSILLVIYFISLPKNKIYSKFDKNFTFLLFVVFLIINIFEEVAESIFWEEFESTFNFIAVDYLVYTKEVIGNIMQSYPVFQIISAIVVLSLAVAFAFKKFLYPQIVPPDLKGRFFSLFLVIFLCVLS